MTDLTTDFLAAFDIDALTDAASDYAATDVVVIESDDGVHVSLCIPDDVDAVGLCEHAAWAAPHGWDADGSGMIGVVVEPGHDGAWTEVWFRYVRR